MRRGFVAVLAAGLAAGGAAQAPVPDARLYDVTIETGMPNLDEHLRYATIRERRCLARGDLGRAFPALADVSLQDCRLLPVEQDAEGARYALRCSGGHGTEGEARWSFDEAGLAGTLRVRLGGKNMTFYQRVTARAAGACPASSSSGAR